MQKEMEQRVVLAKQGSHKDMDFVFEAFRSNIEICARKLCTSGFDFDDAVQEGNIGLFRAVLSYKQDKGASFETYAKKCILNSIITAYNSSQSQKHQLLSNAKSLDAEAYNLSVETDFLKKEQNKDENKLSIPDKTFWFQRYYYYSKYDEGILMDHECN